MTNGPLVGKIIRFAIPLALSGILQLLFNAADIIVAGRFAGSQALAAVGSTSALINLIVNLFIGLSIGVNVLVARYYGGGNRQDLYETVHTAVLVSMISGVVLIFVGIGLSEPLLTLMGTPEDVIGQAVLYSAGGGGYPAALVLPAVGRCGQRVFEPVLCHRLTYGRGRCGHCHGDLPVHLRRAGAFEPGEK